MRVWTQFTWLSGGVISQLVQIYRYYDISITSDSAEKFAKSTGRKEWSTWRNWNA